MSERLGSQILVDDLQGVVVDFSEERPSMRAHNHNEHHLSMSLAIEAMEVMEIDKLSDFYSEDEFTRRLGQELADVMIYLLEISHLHGIDIAHEVVKKVILNQERFPADQFQGVAENFPHQYMSLKIKNGERK